MMFIWVDCLEAPLSTHRNEHGNGRYFSPILYELPANILFETTM